MCHPGRPGPQGEPQVGSPGLADFQRAKSEGLRFLLSRATRSPARLSSYAHTHTHTHTKWYREKVNFDLRRFQGAIWIICFFDLQPCLQSTSNHCYLKAQQGAERGGEGGVGCLLVTQAGCVERPADGVGWGGVGWGGVGRVGGMYAEPQRVPEHAQRDDHSLAGMPRQRTHPH